MLKIFIKYKELILALIIFLLGFFYRAYPIFESRPLWVDEFCSITQSIKIQNGYSFFNLEHQNTTTHFLIFVSRLIFGDNNFAYLFPSIIIGSLSILLLYLFAANYFNQKIAFISSLLLATSYFEITWSNQIRGYVLQQFLSLLFIGVLFNNKMKVGVKLFLLILIGFIGIITHKMFLLLLLAAGIFYLFSNIKKAYCVLNNNISKFIILVIFLFFIFYFSGFFETIYIAFKFRFLSLYNNFWYYKNFLWNNHTSVSLLCISGLILSLFNKKITKISQFFIIYFFIHLFFITFIFGHYMTKYIFPIYIYFLLYMAYSICYYSAELIKKINFKKINLELILSFLFTIVIIFLGNNFVRKPQKYYSVNKDMREIAVIDYDKMYEIINHKKDEYGQNNIAIVETWDCRTNYYNGLNKENLYWFRWINAGFRKSTAFSLNKENEKLVLDTGEVPIKLIGELFDLEKAMTKFQFGFIWIDDTSLPQDVQDYVHENFYKEIYLESYGPEILENPYSIWPGTLYSWGFETPNPFYSKPTQDVIE